MERTISVDGRDVRFRASAAVPRLYRLRFRRDIIQDMQTVQRAIAKAENARKAALANGEEDPGSSLPMEALTLFENAAFLMAKHADPDAVPETVDEWLDSFEVFSIYSIFPEISKLWEENLLTLSSPKKKSMPQSGK